ncbi:hypothetical protein L798_01440 [Zootermopsis nevadensis]|uniref:Uncharacterized protein n=1 Tax=Zootermopsis nevadensis TaxID=136037 RepID=A0A067RP89_ZOONE|nr:hypothetical protein L798_01440 [Zootermopsis nevadensis]
MSYFQRAKVCNFRQRLVSRSNKLHMFIPYKLQYYCYRSGHSCRCKQYDSSALFQQVSTNGSDGRRRCKKATTAEQTTKSGSFYHNSSQDEQRNEEQLAFCA